MSLQGRLMAAVKAWQEYGKGAALSQQAQESRLALLGALYTGTWRSDPRWPWASVPIDTYRNARQVVKMTKRIVGFYEQFIWQGDLSTDGKPLPDGTRGAIPIDPQTGDEEANARLLVAMHQNFSIWQWRKMMGIVPKTAAIFGDCLVELIFEPNRGIVMPNIVYPGYVPDVDLELDSAGNIKAYALEFPVQVEASTAFGRDVKAESYQFRKEVDGEMRRYFKDGKPFAYPDTGDAEQRNPYGFVSAVLYCHELQIGSHRGIGAYEHTVNQALDINNTLSSATDYQRQQFGAPVLVKGSALRPSKTYTMPGGVTITTGATAADIDAARRETAETMRLLPVTADGGYEAIQFDIGQTMEMVRFVHDGLLAENPEAEYAKRLLEMSQVTGPGGRIILSPIQGLIDGARRNYDPPMLAQSQMGVSMMGFHVHNGDIPARLLRTRESRYKVFSDFDLSSWDKGLLDASIPTRDVFPESKAEKAQWLSLAADLPPWALRELGIDETDIEEGEAAKREAREAQLAAFSIAGAGNEQEPERQPAGPTGPTGVTG